ncbi:hypothetical protein [Acinetobacter sp. LMB-5]|nr:hypothetical protein [Acinetobacter sp. LMB-5]
MNAQMIRQNYGVKQITLHAMTWSEFSRLVESLDAARYPQLEGAKS